MGCGVSKSGGELSSEQRVGQNGITPVADVKPDTPVVCEEVKPLLDGIKPDTATHADPAPANHHEGETGPGTPDAMPTIVLGQHAQRPAATNQSPGPQHNHRYANGNWMGDSVSATSVGEVASPSPSEEYDDEEDTFTLPRWRRYYRYNKRKHADLLGYLWKKFDQQQLQHFSIFCVSYRHHDMLFADYQGQNLLFGLACRLDHEPLFGVGHVLSCTDTPGKFSLVVLMVVQGAEVPASIQQHPDYEDWQWLKADPKDSEVRDFLGHLLTGVPPDSTHRVLVTQEFNL